MSRQFIAAIALTSLVATGFSAAPARAGEHDTARVLAGITAFLLIGKALNDHGDRKRAAAQGHNNHNNGHNNGHWSHNGHSHYGHNNGHTHNQPVRLDPKPVPPRVRAKTLPKHCMRVVQGQRKQVRMLGARCMQKNYRFTNQLPRACQVKVRTHRGKRFGFKPGCLKGYGYRIRG